MKPTFLLQIDLSSVINYNTFSVVPSIINENAKMRCSIKVIRCMLLRYDRHHKFALIALLTKLLIRCYPWSYLVEGQGVYINGMVRNWLRMDCLTAQIVQHACMHLLARSIMTCLHYSEIHIKLVGFKSAKYFSDL